MKKSKVLAEIFDITIKQFHTIMFELGYLEQGPKALKLSKKGYLIKGKQDYHYGKLILSFPEEEIAKITDDIINNLPQDEEIPDTISVSQILTMHGIGTLNKNKVNKEARKFNKQLIKSKLIKQISDEGTRATEKGKSLGAIEVKNKNDEFFVVWSKEFIESKECKKAIEHFRESHRVGREFEQALNFYFETLKGLTVKANGQKGFNDKGVDIYAYNDDYFYIIQGKYRTKDTNVITPNDICQFYGKAKLFEFDNKELIGDRDVYRLFICNQDIFHGFTKELLEKHKNNNFVFGYYLPFKNMNEYFKIKNWDIVSVIA